MTLVADLMSASDAEFELFWRHWQSSIASSPSGFADLNNIAAPSHTAGASTAAVFLSHFVENYRQISAY